MKSENSDEADTVENATAKAPASNEPSATSGTTNANGQVASVATAQVSTDNTTPANKVYKGVYMENGLRIQVATEDPVNPGKPITQRQSLDLVTNVEITRVVGFGRFPNTGEPYVSIYGQYAPGKTVRLTASGQYYDALRPVLRGNAEIVNGQTSGPLKKPIMVSAAGKSLRGHGMLMSAMWIVEPDGSKKEIFTPIGMVRPGQQNEGTAGNQNVEDLVL